MYVHKQTNKQTNKQTRPGYERSLNTPTGNAASLQYNQIVQLNSIKFAMVAHLKGKEPDPVFGDVIAEHFRLKAGSILTECRKWADEGGTAIEGFTAAVAELKTLLKKIAPIDVAAAEAEGATAADATAPAAIEGGGKKALSTEGGEGEGGAKEGKETEAQQGSETEVLEAEAGLKLAAAAAGATKAEGN